MGRKLNKTSSRLSDLELKQLAAVKSDKTKLHHDGGGLYFVCDRRGSRSWAFRYMRDGKARTFGLGRYPAVGLAEARRRANKAHEALTDGDDPLEQKDAERKARLLARQLAMTFQQAAERDTQAKAAALAEKMWDDATTATDHPYLTRKGISGEGLRVGTWIKDWTKPDGTVKRFTTPNTLMIPIRDGKKQTTSLQGIFAEPVKMGDDLRDKDFVTGGRKRGCWATIGKPTEIDGRLTVGICEGYATGASVYEASALAVVVAFDAGNLEPVAEACRRILPAARIVILADNDQWTDKPVTNPGVTLATEAAEAVGGEIAVPRFKDLSGKPTDWNDLAVLEGRSEVERQLLEILHAGCGAPAPPDALLSAAAQSAPKIPSLNRPRTGAATKPKIHLVKGQLDHVVAAVDQAVQSDPPTIFQRGGRLVRVAVDNVLDEPGRAVGPSTGIVELDVHDARLRVAELGRCVAYDKNGAPLDVDLPKDVAASWLANRGNWGARHLLGVTDVPIFRLADGSIVDVAGYDAPSRLFYSGSCLRLDVRERPTRDDALAAADRLMAVYREFPFKGDSGSRALGWAVVLNYLVTGAIRPYIALAPMTLVSATAPGSGKGLLIEVSNLILHGRDAAVLPPVAGRGRDDEERKRITSLAKQGAVSIHFDNCNREVGSDALNALLTSDEWTDRVLGESNAPTWPARMLVAASGNNLRARGDTVRRALRVELDPEVERPEDRVFEIPNLTKYVRLKRSELLSSVYTILRAFILAEGPGAPHAVLGRYEEWSATAAAAVAWLDLPNPIESQLLLREDDPERAQLVALLAVWHQFFGEEKLTIRLALERLRAAGVCYGGTDSSYSDTDQSGEATQLQRGRILLALLTELGEGTAPNSPGDRHVSAAESESPR